MKKKLVGSVEIGLVVMSLFMVACNYDASPPYPGSTTVASIGPTTATASSRIVWDGGTTIKECGFCWSASPGPTKDDSFIIAELNGDKFSATIEELSDGTKYYIRSYALNKEGIYYGEVKTFTTVAFRMPELFSPYVSFVGHDSVEISGGRVSSDNTGNVLAKGICWSTSGTPTVAGQKVELGPGMGGIGYRFTGLQPSTVYYFRAYATNVVGTAYGSTLNVRTFDGYMRDHEGHKYSTVRLGTQEWMNRNLETRFFSNGEMIGTTGTRLQNIEPEAKPVYQWPDDGYEGYPDRLDDNGRVYTWFTVTDARKLCPAGWHLPSLDEWNRLLDHLGGSNLTSASFRSCYNYHWDRYKNPEVIEGSFWAQLAQIREPSGQFWHSSDYGTYWWTSTESSVSNAWSVNCGPADIDDVIPLEKNKKYGFSVRCLKD